MRLKYNIQNMCIRIFNRLVLFAVLFLCGGCTTITDLSSQSPYAEWMGRQFVLVQDCYVFKFKDDKRTLYVGRGINLMPPDVAPQFVNKQFNGMTLLGILKRGSKFTIVGCYEERDIEDVIRNFEATLNEKTGEFRGAILNVAFLTDLTKNPPVFNEVLAKPLATSK
jgi:hypothetical protein